MSPTGRGPDLPGCAERNAAESLEPETNRRCRDDRHPGPDHYDPGHPGHDRSAGPAARRPGGDSAGGVPGGVEGQRR